MNSLFDIAAVGMTVSLLELSIMSVIIFTTCYVTVRRSLNDLDETVTNLERAVERSQS
jgi:hypothetical protein